MQAIPFKSYSLIQFNSTSQSDSLEQARQLGFEQWIFVDWGMLLFLNRNASLKHSPLSGGRMSYFLCILRILRMLCFLCILRILCILRMPCFLRILGILSTPCVLREEALVATTAEKATNGCLLEDSRTPRRPVAYQQHPGYLTGGGHDGAGAKWQRKATGIAWGTNGTGGCPQMGERPAPKCPRRP